MRAGRFLLLVSSVALLVGSSTVTGAGIAQSAPFCADAQPLDWLDAFAPLSAQLGDVMGAPVECPHAATEGGDTVQQTSTGVATLRSPGGQASFTDGTTRWALTEQGLVNWKGTSLDPPRREVLCRTLPVRGFGQVFSTVDEAYGLIGCPTSAESGLDVATQRFQHGWMIWRAARATNDPATIFVLFEDDQHYVRFDDTYSPAGDPESGAATPPPGLQQPVRGFGKVWREGTVARVRERLGWATMAESPGQGATEYFLRGTLLWTPAPREIFLLAATTAERPQQVLQVWRVYADTFSEPAGTLVAAAQGEPTPIPTAAPRLAPSLQYHSVKLPDWPTALEVPLGFTVEEAAAGLTSPRFMALDADGSLVFGSHLDGRVVRLRDTRHTGHFDLQQEVASGLTYVHSVVFVDGKLYAAAEDRIVLLDAFAADGRAGIVQTIVDDLPAGARDLYGHRTRTLLLGPDHKIYLSIGSACDVCEDDNPMRAAVLRMDPNGSNMEVVASGLRNSVGIAFRPQTDPPQLWGNDMGRNNIGPDLPPDKLNLISAGLNYGWPYCYGDRQPNPEFNDADRCATTESPRMLYPPHWSLLGIVFYDGASFPAEYRGDALIAFHGSAIDQTGDTRGGYNVVRVHFEGDQPVWQQELLRGFVQGAGAWGRPVGLLVTPDGSVLVSDDYSGRIFRIRYTG